MEWGDDWGDLWGGALSDITTHGEDAVKRLPDWNDKTNNRFLMNYIGERWQAIEDVLAQVAPLYDLRTAYGYYQDQLGAILNQPRYAQPTEEYRVLLRARAHLIKRRRTSEDTLTLVRILIDDDGRDFSLVDIYPKGYKITVENLTVDEITLWAPYLKLCKPATYNGLFVVTVTDAFGNSDASAALPPSPPPHGFGDASGAVAGGGPLSYVVPF